MLFLDLWFWGFAAVALPGFWLLRSRAKLLWLVAASAVLHWYYCGPAGMAPILVLAAVTYGVGIRLGRGDVGDCSWGSPRCSSAPSPSTSTPT